MAKNIVLLSDGTGNSARSTTPTNVGRLYAALSLEYPEEQIAFYDDGVGTQRLKPLKILGGAFGYGLRANVIEMYKFLCRSYDDGDRIYLFGFSRGAYTVRVLVGLVHRCGLIAKDEFSNEAELHKAAQNNYTKFRKSFNRIYTRAFKRPTKKARAGQSEERNRPDIQFLGVWDTVDAYGLPIDELAVLWDNFIYPYRFRDRTLSDLVLKARHAIALDDERHTFHPVLWDESDEDRKGSIEQVWFAGVHANVGGGYPDDSLAHVSLDWMLAQIDAVNGKPGLDLIQSEAARLSARKDMHGKLFNSRSGLQVYYRYKPRRMEEACNDQKNGVKARINIHESAFERIKDRIAAYYPIGIAENYNVVSNNSGNPPPSFENDDQKAKRAEKFKNVWGVVSWRQILYKIFVFVTSAFVIAPVLYRLFYPTLGNCLDQIPLIPKIILAVVDGVLPNFSRYWTDALRCDTQFFWGFVIVFAVIFAALIAARTVLIRHSDKLAADAWSHVSGQTTDTELKP